MAIYGIETAETRRRAAESAARVVLAKHPCVVPGSVPTEARVDPAPPARAADVGARNVGRSLGRQGLPGFR